MYIYRQKKQYLFIYLMSFFMYCMYNIKATVSFEILLEAILYSDMLSKCYEIIIIGLCKCKDAALFLYFHHVEIWWLSLPKLSHPDSSAIAKL